MRSSITKGINLAEAVKAAPQESGSQLTFAELSHARRAHGQVRKSRALADAARAHH